MKAPSDSNTRTSRRSGKRGLLSGAGGAALALACLFPSAAWAADYEVNSEADLRQVLLDAAANGDPNPRIILGSSFQVSNTAFTLPNVPVTIDTQGFVLTTPDSGGMSIIGPSASNTLNLAGTFTGISSPPAGTPGLGLALTGTGTVNSTATITGGSTADVGEAPGIGVSLIGTLTFVNDGTIAAGDSVSFTHGPSGGNQGVAASIFSGGTLINNNLIQGSNGQAGSDGFAIYSRNLANASFIVNNDTIRGGSNADLSTGGAAIRGFGLNTATITNNSGAVIMGGNGAAAIQAFNQAWRVHLINSGTVSAGAGGTTAIDMGPHNNAGLTLELRPGSVINGNVIASTGLSHDTFILGGTGTDSFNTSTIGAAAQYRNFDFFRKTGSGKWTLTGDVAINWTIDEGTLEIGDGVTGPVLGQISNNGVLAFNQSGTYTKLIGSGGITGSGSILQSGSGTTILEAVILNYTGGTTITNGVLQVFADSTLGTGALTIDGGTLRVMSNSGGSVTTTLGVNGGTFDILGSFTAQNVTGGGALTKTGTGSLTLVGDATYTGGTTIAEGALILRDGILGDVLNNGTLAFSNATARSYDLVISGSGNVSVSGSATTTLTGNSSWGGTTSVTGAGGLTIDGATIAYGGSTSISLNTGLRIIGGADVTSGGGTNMSRGAALTVDGANSVFSTGSIGGTITGASTTSVNVTNGGTLRTTNGGLNFRTLTGAAVQLNVTGAGSLAEMAGGLQGGSQFNSPFALAIGAGGTLRTGDASQIGAAAATNAAPNLLTATITGPGSNWTSTSSLLMTAGTFTLDQGGTASFTNATFGSSAATGASATVTVSGAGSRLTTTTGDLVIGSGSGTGTLTLANGGAVDVAGTLALGDAATATGVFNIGGGEGQAAVTAGMLTAPTISLGGTASRINFNHTDTDYVLGAGISGSGLINQLAGVSRLTGDSSGFTGEAVITGGALLVNGSLGDASSIIHVLGGGTLGGIGTIGGDVFVGGGAALAPGSNGVGGLTVNGNLDFSPNASLNFELGRADTTGGALNDVVNVGGNLALDGTLNVQTPVGGSFDPGLYRIFNYGGTLTNTGLTIGTIPSPDFYVQTSVANQVNLVNTAGLVFRYWDGADAKNNGMVNGGNGLWQNATGNDNWVDDGNVPNAQFADSAFAVFMGGAGNVEVDDSLGAVNAAGMQFLTDGYRITGDTLTLVGPQAVIRVGDGSTVSAGTTATIDSVLTGSAQLVKSDVGTLVLTGANTYTGGTAINGGVLRIANDASLGNAASGISFDGGLLQTTVDLTGSRTVDLIGEGGFLTDAGTTLEWTGTIGGAGSLVKDGAGTLILSAANSYAGGARVDAGTLFVNGDQSAAVGLTTVNSGATLAGLGTIGGDVAIGDGGTLNPGGLDGLPAALTIGGNLSLAAGSTLAMQFGEAGAAGGSLNDLIEVGGDLVLDGTLDVGVPAGGDFDIGIYRVFNYGGTLTNNGLSLGATPAGSTISVQTSVLGQVNLVNTAGLTLNFWDGAAGPKFDGVINGGSGVWQNSTGNDNWTEETGRINTAYVDGGFAVFTGAGGTVTVDNSLGQVTSSGMQFAANGYTIAGGGVALVGPQSTIRVGEGRTSDSGMTATIGAALSGASELVKTGSGKLVLAGSNSYTGGTTISGGTLAISADANLGDAAGGISIGGGTLQTTAGLASRRAFTLAGDGTILTDQGTTFTLNGPLAGPGALTKAGAGTLLLTGDNAGYVAAARVAGGTLTINGTLGSAVDVAGAGRLQGNGRVASITNAGVIAPGNSIGTLTVAGNYAGSDGRLEIEAVLGGDASPTDRLVVAGATSGSTRVTVINQGGLGAQTVEGIKIVDVAGASNGTFALDGDYVFQGEQAVIGGAYGYRLYQGGVSTPADGDWYLRSALLDAAGEPAGPLYQPGVPIYEAYGANLQALNGLPTLQQRVGNRSWAAGAKPEGSGVWGRMEGTRNRAHAAVSTSLSDQKVNSWKMQLGVDRVLAGTGKGERLVAGVTAYYGQAESHVRSFFGNGSIKTDGYGLGATLTWYGLDGFYADGQVQLSWYDSDLRSSLLGDLAQNDGKGQALSLEVGKRTPVGGKLSITPQVQMVYSNVGFDRFADPANAIVASAKGDSLKTRWGVSLDHQNEWDSGRSHVYGLVNLSYEWLEGTRTRVSGTPFDHANERLGGELGLGASVSWASGVTIYGEVSGNSPFQDFGDSYTLKANAGVRIAF